MKRHRLLQPVINVTLVMLFAVGCGASTPTLPTTISTPVPPTSKPIPPTSTPMPTPWVEGTLTDKDTNKPLSNALLILCQRQNNLTSCQLNTKLTATTDANGKFKLEDVPAGTYAILYNVSGNIQQDLNNKILDYSPQAQGVFGKTGFGHIDNLIESLGITSVQISCGSSMGVVDGNLVISGYIYAESVDLGFIFVKGDMIYVTINTSPEKLELRVWDTQNDKCEGGEFKPLP